MAEHQQHPIGNIKAMLPDKGPSTSQIVAVVALVPIGGILLTIAGLTLTATIIGLALATPVFVIFSPVLIPAAITIGLAVAGFLTSGAFGLTALSSLSRVINYVRSARVPEQLDLTKRRMADAAGQMGQQVGQRTKEMGQAIQQKAQ